jgi:hypothetical protein
MFIKSKYTDYYNNIIANAKKRNVINGFCEKHHIIPKSVGGTDEESNMVILTYKEHYVAHHLLTKMFDDKDSQRKMWTAFFFMHIGRDKEIKTNRSYVVAKRKMAEGKSILNSGEGNPMYGKTHPEETKNKMSKSWNRKSLRNTDKKIYTFVHKEYGVEKCTRLELCKKYNISHKLVYKIVKRQSKSTLGWKIKWENEVILKENPETITKRHLKQ